MTLKPARLQWSEDGSRLVNLDYDDVYFQIGQGIAESTYVFLQHNNLPARFAAGDIPHFRLCEMGFGTGLNFLLTTKLFLEAAPAQTTLTFVSIEKHPIDRDMLQQLHTHWPDLADISADMLSGYPPLIEGFHTILLAGGRVRLILALGDAADMLPQITGPFDAWYLDGFTPRRNPAMWEEYFYPLIAAKTAAGGTLSSFSVVSRMRHGLAAAGFTVKKIDGFGIKFSMTVAHMESAPVPHHPGNAIVIGAGIAGCSVARGLALRGVPVTLIDKHGAVAKETSGNPLAVVYPKMTVDVTPMGMLYQHGFCMAREMIRAFGIDSFTPCGVLHMDTDADTAARHKEIINRNAYPADYVRYDDAQGLFQPMAGFVPPANLCQKLVDHPLITIRQGTVQNFHRNGDAWCVETDNDTHVAKHVVIATGTQAGGFDITDWLPLQSLRGQITVVKVTPESEKLAHVVCHDGYITPAIDGTHCIGATFQKEPVGNTDTRAEDDVENVQKLQQILPHLDITERDILSSRAGYRMTTPDKLPMVGRVPDAKKFIENFAGLRHGSVDESIEKPYIDGLHIAAGFGAHGMTTAPLAGEIIAADICQTPLPCPQSLADALKPERFILRDLKRGKI